jgi:hypothetical protein
MPLTKNNIIHKTTSIVRSSSADSLQSKSVKAASSIERQNSTASDDTVTATTAKPIFRSSLNDDLRRKVKSKTSTAGGDDRLGMLLQSHQTASSSIQAPFKVKSKAGMSADGDDHSVMSRQYHQTASAPRGIPQPLSRFSSMEAPRRRRKSASDTPITKNPMKPSMGSTESLQPVAPRRTFKKSSFDLPDPLIARIATQPAEKVSAMVWGPSRRISAPDCKAAATAATALKLHGKMTPTVRRGVRPAKTTVPTSQDAPLFHSSKQQRRKVAPVARAGHKY